MRTTLTVAITLLFGATAAADFPLPAHLKTVDRLVRFEGIEKFPEKIFYLRYSNTNGAPRQTDPPTLARAGAETIRLAPGRHMHRFEILAVDRGAFDEHEKSGDLAVWLAGSPEGILVASPPPPSDAAPISSLTPPVTTYRLSIQNGSLDVEAISPPLVERAVTGNLPIVVYGSAIALGVAAAGLWFVRRRRAR